MNYHVQLDGETILVQNFDLRKQMAEINGQRLHFDVHQVSGDLYSLLVNGEVYSVQIAEVEGRQQICIGHQTFNGTVEDERQAVFKKLQSQTEAESSTALVKAPMPGLVVRLEVQKGERVEKGQGLIVIEAMKMENEIRSPAAGTVADILVEARAPVEKGAPLMRIKS